MSGWVKLHRKLQDNPLWTCEAFSRGQAWVDLLMLANHAPSYFMHKGCRIDVGRGVVARSKEKLAERWQWSRGKVIRFLSALENDQQIVQQTVHHFGLITICNYYEYQENTKHDGTTNGTTDGTVNGTTDGQQTVQRTVHIQEEKQQQEEKEGKEKQIPRKRDVFVPPPWMPGKLWSDYVSSRRSMKKHPMSDSALELSCTAIEKCVSAGYEVEDVLKAMTANGWRSVKPDWMNNEHGDKSKSSVNTHGGFTPDRYAIDDTAKKFKLAGGDS